MEKLIKLAEEIIPLSRKQNLLVLLTLIFSFNFLFFAMPTLADEAVAAQETQAETISSDSVTKETQPNDQILEMIKSQHFHLKI